jgi:hypothetical protein
VEGADVASGLRQPVAAAHRVRCHANCRARLATERAVVDGVAECVHRAVGVEEPAVGRRAARQAPSRRATCRCSVSNA